MKLPKRAGDGPTKVNLEKDKRYAWCACGFLEKQPFCDGAHKGHDMHPNVFTAEENKEVYLCNCKQTKNAPYCDGSHKNS